MEEILIWEQQRMASRWPKPLLNWCPVQKQRDWQVDPIGSMLVQPLSETKPLYQDKK
jgi:hypothetical protein